MKEWFQKKKVLKKGLVSGQVLFHQNFHCNIKNLFCQMSSYKFVVVLNPKMKQDKILQQILPLPCSKM